MTIHGRELNPDDLIEIELRRKLAARDSMATRARELKQQKEAEAAQQKREREAAQKIADAAVDARELATLKNVAASNWPGSRSSFDAFWTNGGADRVRADELTRRMAAPRQRIADLND